MDGWYRQWPGKSDPPHLAVHHMLDVAAVAERLLLPLDLPGPRREALVLLAALHDLGKIGAQFRAMIVDGQRQQGGLHWEVTEVLLRRHDGLLAPVLGMTPRHRYALYAATAGHHGRPPGADKAVLDRMAHFAGPEAIEDAGRAIAAFVALWPAASLADLGRTEVTALSWWLPGLVAAADWIGSNAVWFPPPEADLPLADYLERARALAGDAVAAAGLTAPAPSAAPLFSFAPRPMQVAAAEVPLREGPMLALIEDETGAGKTEAALILAQRMMAAGKGRGLYFALPTMATADAMFARLREVAGRLFASAPSLTLAHGRAGLSVPFRDLQNAERANPDEPGCSGWLAADRRRALLADVGIGTVDQALLGVLPTRHACLRLYGLGTKILIVDEVHEMGEPYMAELLAGLLHALAALGGSAILLTATLPLDLRARLVAAFETGAGRDTAAPADPAYPALTVAGGAARTDLPRAVGPRGPVAVARLEGPAAAADELAARAGQGAACVWVRNSVDEAIAAVGLLRGRGVVADLLHARFALEDRKRHEAAALARFGKAGQGRAGRVLVATQVVESSLDLDFDVMVSDLAPMAALIQRAGRLWRHMDLRPAASRPGAAAVSGPVLQVVSPDPGRVADARWLHAALGAGAHVYDLPLMWRTAEVLFRVGRIAAPGDLRGLIEAAHGDAGSALPAALERADIEAEGRAHTRRAHGARTAIDFDKGYREGAGDWKDLEVLTRLGRPVRRLVLARRAGGGLRPWAERGSDAERWQLSEVQAAESRLAPLDLPDQSAPEILALTEGWPAWRREAVTVCPVGEDGAICAGLRYVAEAGLILSSP